MIAVILMVLSPFVIAYPIIKPAIKQIHKMQKAREGVRTKFVIDTTDKGFDYYKDAIDKWLSDVGFSKYKSKKKARYLKYHIKGNIFKFGFNYYQQENKLIIEAWLRVLGKESPLTMVLYQANADEETERPPLALDQQGKDEYLNFLKTLIVVPQVVYEVNQVTLQNYIEISNFRSEQKQEKSSTMKMIWGIILFSVIVSLFINFIGK